MINKGREVQCVIKTTGEVRTLLVCFDTDITEGLTAYEKIEGCGKFCYYLDALTGEIFSKEDAYIKPMTSYEMDGIECDEGWKCLYQPLIDYIDAYNAEHPEDVIEIHQIKEKFGGLRFYVDHAPEELRTMIREAEYESFAVCERCGSRENVGHTSTGWMQTVCKDCLSKQMISPSYIGHGVTWINGKQKFRFTRGEKEPELLNEKIER